MHEDDGTKIQGGFNFSELFEALKKYSTIPNKFLEDFYDIFIPNVEKLNDKKLISQNNSPSLMQLHPLEEK